MAGVPATVTSTGSVIPFDPGALIAIAALKVPPPCSAAGFTVTRSVLGRLLPEEGATVSQPPPLLVMGVAVNELIAELLLETVTACDAGTVLLAAKLKLSEFGLVESGLIPPVVLGLNTTGTERNPPEVLILMNPTSVVVGAGELIDTAKTSGLAPLIVPLVGLTCSQFVSEKAATVTFVCPLEDVICSGCVGDDGPLNRS